MKGREWLTEWQTGADFQGSEEEVRERECEIAGLRRCFCGSKLGAGLARATSVRGRQPLDVSLSRMRYAPALFAGARSCRSASFLVISLKNHLQKTQKTVRIRINMAIYQLKVQALVEASDNKSSSSSSSSSSSEKQEQNAWRSVCIKYAADTLQSV